MSENYREYNETNISVVSPQSGQPISVQGEVADGGHREKIIQITKGTQNCIDKNLQLKYLIAIQHMREFVKYLAECFNHTKPKLYANHKLV